MVNQEVLAITKRNRRKEWLVLNGWCWLFMAPAVIFYILFQGYPILCSSSGMHLSTALNIR